MAQVVGESYSPQLTQLTLSSFLTSPIVKITVGQGENETVLTAHQTLLLESPFLNEIVGKFGTSGPVSHDQRTTSNCHVANTLCAILAVHSPPHRECRGIRMLPPIPIHSRLHRDAKR